MSTPPVTSSTPLPPEDHPLLLGNRAQQYNDDDGDKTIANIDDEATIIQILNKGKQGVHRSSSPENEPDLDETLSNENHNSRANNITVQYSKFDKGTIKLNMVEQTHKDMLKTAKIINISPSPEVKAAVQKVNKQRSRRSHVKDIFADFQKPTLVVRSARSESCRTPPSTVKTPLQKERSNSMSMNILSSPYSNIDHEMRSHPVMSPDKAQLRDARSTARIQLKQELTGKRLVLSPNVPLMAPDSPVSNFLRRVKRNVEGGNGGGSIKTLNKMSGSLESLGTDGTVGSSDGKKLNGPGISKWRSAYDFVAKSDSDED